MTVNVVEAQQVNFGQTIAVIEAMEMEAAIATPNAGTVVRIAVTYTAQVEGGDLLAVVSQPASCRRTVTTTTRTPVTAPVVRTCGHLTSR